MSTLSGIAAKGEKGKPRFRSLDINNIYSAIRGESSEPNQHKNTASRRHGGMQSLGKVPSARRPANLPSLRSEYSGNDPAISLVPSGGTGWGSKPGETGPPPTATQATTTSTPTPPLVTPATSSPATVTATVSTPTTSTCVASTTIPIQSHGDKSWSSITSSSSENTPMFLAHQSPYFQQQFPSLSGDGGNLSGPNKIDPAHLPGPSLRPQNEGNWIQGGGRPQGQMGAGVGSQQGTVPVQGPLSLPHLPQGLDVGSNLGPSGVGGGPAGPMPPSQHFRLMPPFMLKHNMPAGGFPPNYQHGPPRPRFQCSDTRFIPPNRGPPNAEHDDLSSRPIIKEEDLKVMDEIGRDTGWAGHDEIDYNQTLSFSDEEGAQDDEFKSKIGRQFLQNKEKREVEHKPIEMEASSTGNDKLNQDISRESMISTHTEMRDSQLAWQQLATARPADIRQGVLNFPPPQARVPGHQGGRQGEDDEVVQERRRMHTEELAIAVEKAKQRKEEEEKRYEETRLAAARKLLMLEEKMRSKSRLEKEERNISPPLNVHHGSNVLIPEWEKDRSRKNSEERDEKSPKENLDNFRNTQSDNRGQNRERENTGQHSFARQQFSNNLPPRLQRQAAENRPSPYYRQSCGSSPQPPSSGNPQYDNRWQANQSASHFGGSTGVTKNYRSHKDSQMSECDKEDNTRERETGFESREKDRSNRPPSRDKNNGGWESQGYSAESSIFMLNSENEHKHDYSNNKMPANSLDSDSFSIDKERENDRFQEEKGNDMKSNHSIQDDAFVERSSSTQDNKLENEMRDIPQRPESRECRDDRLLEETNSHETMLPWADFTYDVEDKRRKDESDPRRDLHVMQSMYQRHIPGPITKEKLEASELKCESSRSLNLVPLTRSEPKTEVKKSENKWELGNNSGDAWQQVPAPTTQAVNKEAPSQDIAASQPLPDASQDNTNECLQDVEDSKKTVPKPSHIERDHFETSGGYKHDIHRGGRGGQRGVRHDSQRSKPWLNNYFRGGSMWQRDRGPMPPNRRSNMGRDWSHHDPESEASDEVSASTESGKEDRRHDQDRKQFSRSPKRGVRKTDKDMKDNYRKYDSDKNSYSLGNENRRYDKKPIYENNQMGAGFEPSGVPSRRGRGAFRSKGSSTTLGRGMVDGYGPPTSKKPFSESMASGSQEDKKSDSSQNQTINKEDNANDMSHDEKMKLNQQQLSAGIIANTSRHVGLKSQSQSIPPRLQRKDSDRKLRDRRPRESMKSGSGSGGEVEDEDYESTSEHEDRSCGDDKQNENSRKPYNQGMSTRGNHRRQSSNRNFGRDKNNGSSYDKEHNLRRSGHQSMVNGNMRNQSSKEQVTTEQSMGDKKQSRPDYKDKRNNLDRIDLSNTASVVVVDDQPEVTVEEDQRVFATDNNGFQEVRSKKNVKEANRQQKEEPQRRSKERPKPSKPPSSQSPGPQGSAAPSSKVLCDRTRMDKLAPRFMKLKQQNRQEKITQQQQTHDVGELNKINQSNLPGFPSKDMTNAVPPPQVNAWAKPITAALHTSTGLIDSCNIEVADHMHSTTSSQRSSPNDDKAVGKQPAEKAMLDGTSPPVQTIIFENTNYKAAPADVAMKSKYSNQVNKNQRPDKTRDKNIEEDNIAVGFKSPGPDIQLQDTKSDSIQMPMSFVKNEDSADMKLDFRFDSELSQLTDDKSSKSITSIQMTRSIQMATQSSAADLQFKLASVKKVWENPSTVLEHSGEEANNVAAASSFTPTFGNSVEDPGNYGKPNDSSVGDDGNTSECVYNSSQQLQNNSNAYNGSSVQNMIKPDPSSNVCKVKPLPQSGMHPHAGPLSPPVGPFASSLAQPSHINYQPPPGQYGGIPAIPSPPNVYTQSHEHLYQAIQINNTQMLNRQATSQFSQYTPYMSQGLSQTSGFSQQNMYLAQTAPPPPTGAAAPAHPDMFQTQISQFRIQPPAYGANQQLNTNPSTMLISSQSMKPPPQPIGAIGSKAASFQPTSQPPSQLLIYPDPQIMNQNYIQNSQLVQRPPNSVVSAIPPSSASYYSASTGGNATAYFQTGNSNMHHLPPFSTQTPAATPAGMGSFGSLPRVILQNAVQTAVVGSRVPSTVHRSNSPAPHRTTSSPHINKLSQHSS